MGNVGARSCEPSAATEAIVRPYLLNSASAPVDTGPVVTPTPKSTISGVAGQSFDASVLFSYNDPFCSPAT
jgi:hypothetical protein